MKEEFYQNLTPGWFQIGRWLRYTEYSKSHSSPKIGELVLFLRKIFSQMAIVKHLVKALYCSQKRSVRKEQTEF